MYSKQIPQERKRYLRYEGRSLQRTLKAYHLYTSLKALTKCTQKTVGKYSIDAKRKFQVKLRWHDWIDKIMLRNERNWSISLFLWVRISFILALHWLSNLHATIRLRCSESSVTTRRATVRGTATHTLCFHLAPNRSPPPSESGWDTLVLKSLCLWPNTPTVCLFINLSLIMMLRKTGNILLEKEAVCPAISSFSLPGFLLFSVTFSSPSFSHIFHQDHHRHNTPHLPLPHLHWVLSFTVLTSFPLCSTNQ